jgi:predicted TPR repeat methyltransferase
MARTLVGVDLSSKMLEKARERRLYDRLEQLDLMAMMQAEPSKTYDLVIAADVFVYLGKLDALAMEVHRLLRAESLFAFSVESLDALADRGDDDSRAALLSPERYGTLRPFRRLSCASMRTERIHELGQDQHADSRQPWQACRRVPRPVEEGTR